MLPTIGCKMRSNDKTNKSTSNALQHPHANPNCKTHAKWLCHHQTKPKEITPTKIKMLFQSNRANIRTKCPRSTFSSPWTRSHCAKAHKPAKKNKSDPLEKQNRNACSTTTLLQGKIITPWKHVAGTICRYFLQVLSHFASRYGGVVEPTMSHHFDRVCYALYDKRNVGGPWPAQMVVPLFQRQKRERETFVYNLWKWVSVVTQMSGGVFMAHRGWHNKHPREGLFTRRDTAPLHFETLPSWLSLWWVTWHCVEMGALTLHNMHG